MLADNRIYFYHTDSEAVPPSPWVELASGGGVVGDDGLSVSGSGRRGYRIALCETDNGRGPSRVRDYMAFQIRIEGASFTAGWGSGASGIGFWLDDGARAVGVSFGDDLALINPVSGAVLATIQNGYDWTKPQTLMLIKFGGDRWELWRDGRRVIVFPYLAGAASAGYPAEAGYGLLDSGGSGSAVFDAVEVGLNMALPPRWKVDRFMALLPPSIQKRWTKTARAIARAGLGALETPIQLLESCWGMIHGGQLAEYMFSFSGVRLPSLEPRPWTLINSARISVLRERIRLNAAGSAVAVSATFPSTSAPSTADLCFRASWRVASFTEDAQGRVGPVMALFAGAKVVTAQLARRVVGGDPVFDWVFTNGVVTGGAYTEVGSVRWQVDPYQLHTVEIQIVGGAWVLLLVGGAIVDRVALADFPASVTPAGGMLGIPGVGAGPTTKADLEHVELTRRVVDESKRPMLLQNLVDRLVFVGGRESNAELIACGRAHHGGEVMRGTTQGILVEMKRLTMNPDCFVSLTETPGGWFLERSWPEITPIWLEYAGYLRDVFVEFGIGALNFTPQQLADLLAFYTVPLSSLELQYHICLATVTTSAASSPGVGRTRFPVVSATGFSVGDVITVRDGANTTTETLTILQVVSGTVIDTNTASNASAFLTGSVLRKELATT